MYVQARASVSRQDRDLWADGENGRADAAEDQRAAGTVVDSIAPVTLSSPNPSEITHFAYAESIIFNESFIICNKNHHFSNTVRSKTTCYAIIAP